MKTNTKKNFLKLGTIALVFFFAVNFAKAQADPVDFVDVGVIESYVTIDKTMPFYVTPDSYYHPTWTAFSTNLTPGFSWNWTATGGWTWGNELTLTSQTDNYVTITANVLGDYVVNVKEQASAAFGGCEDPDGTDITIRVVEAPVRNSFPYFTSLGIADGEVYNYCGAMAAADVTVNLTGFPKHQIQWGMTRVVLDGNGDEVGTPDDIITYGPYNLDGSNGLTRSTADYVLHNYAHTLVDDNKPTKYVYTIGGINDLISRKSDYLGTATWYNNTDVVYTIIVSPAPNTGPIFHIPNDFSNL